MTWSVLVAIIDVLTISRKAQEVITDLNNNNKNQRHTNTHARTNAQLVRERITWRTFVFKIHWTPRLAGREKVDVCDFSHIHGNEILIR